MNKQYRSPVMASIHETVEELAELGLIDQTEKRQFDKVCLKPVNQLQDSGDPTAGLS